MRDKINNIIPTIFAEMESDGENDSAQLLKYYMGCDTGEKSAVNNTLMYLCGWSFETILEKCGIGIDEAGNPILS